MPTVAAAGSSLFETVWAATVVMPAALWGGRKAGAQSRQEDRMTDKRLPFQRLDAYVVAKALAKRVHDAKISDKELREQATDAAKSTFLRLCEGLPLEGAAMRRKYFNESHASLFETLGAVD